EEDGGTRLLRRVAGGDEGDELLVLAVDLDDALLRAGLPLRERAVVCAGDRREQRDRCDDGGGEEVHEGRMLARAQDRERAFEDRVTGLEVGRLDVDD